ncbi:hypothetical protein [Streptomyces xiamenensis]|uniref:hypothetical protein n=1 Tax=Streptomyces xiamenensis TaxID=408015 RepID=UPI0035DE51C3
MRKRTSRPPSFAAVDNRAIDGLPSLLAVGLLTRLIRARDGEDVTVESLSKEYDEGEAALSKAMRHLVEAANVVKFKVQRARSETVIEDDREVVKRGGSWWTTFSADSIPFTADDVADMMHQLESTGNVKNIRIEPTYLDPRQTEAPKPSRRLSRPTPQNAGVGPTCENTDSEPPVDTENPEKSGPRPTPQKPTPGRPTPGQGGALSKTVVVEDSLSPSSSSQDSNQGERESAAPPNPDPLPEIPQPRAQEFQQQQDAARVVEAYVLACRSTGAPAFRKTQAKIHGQALELLAGGCPVQWLAERAAEMPAYRWTDLELHASRSKVPMSTAVERREADLDCPTCCGSGFEEVEGQRTGRPCPCLSAPAPAAAGAR